MNMTFPKVIEIQEKRGMKFMKNKGSTVTDTALNAAVTIDNIIAPPPAESASLAWQAPPSNGDLRSNPRGHSMMFPAKHMLGSRRNGVNHVSMNLGSFNRASGPVRGTDYPTYSDALLDWYKTKNVNSVRLMFTLRLSKTWSHRATRQGRLYLAVEIN
jgi:hypothetical protein